MCNVLCEIIKCPARIICCCCECALSLVLSIIASFVITLVVIGLIVYFVVYHNKDPATAQQSKEVAERLIREVPQNFRDYFKSLN